MFPLYFLSTSVDSFDAMDFSKFRDFIALILIFSCRFRYVDCKCKTKLTTLERAMMDMHNELRKLHEVCQHLNSL